MRIVGTILVLMLWCTAAHANCAIEKKPEFDALLEELRTLDVDMALAARKAFGIVSSFEAFDKESERCEHINKLIEDVKESIESLK